MCERYRGCAIIGAAFFVYCDVATRMRIAMEYGDVVVTIYRVSVIASPWMQCRGGLIRDESIYDVRFQF